MAETEQKEVTFIARCKNLVLTLEAGYDAVKSPNGAVLAPASPGRHAEFQDGVLRTSDPDLIAELRGHRLFNLVTANNGFYEEGNSPDEAKPTIKAQLGALARAAAVADLDGINTVVETERDTHKRELVLSTAQEYLEALADGDASKKESAPSPSISTPSVPDSRA